MDELCLLTDLLLEAALVSAVTTNTIEANGGAENMMSLNKPTDPKTYSPELTALLEKASKGDLTVLPELKKALRSRTRSYVSGSATCSGMRRNLC